MLLRKNIQDTSEKITLHTTCYKSNTFPAITTLGTFVILRLWGLLPFLSYLRISEPSLQKKKAQPNRRSRPSKVWGCVQYAKRYEEKWLSASPSPSYTVGPKWTLEDRGCEERVGMEPTKCSNCNNSLPPRSVSCWWHTGMIQCSWVLPHLVWQSSVSILLPLGHLLITL